MYTHTHRFGGHKMNKRLTSLTILLSLILTAVSCGNNSDVENKNTDAGTSEAQTTEKPYLDSLGEYDFEGADVTFLVRETRIEDYFPEESTGDVVNDAFYDRNLKIANRFNVNIKTVTLPDVSSDWNTAIQGDVMSGSGEYDIVMPDYYWGCEKNGWFLNLLDFDVLDFDSPWWTDGWNDNATIYGQLYNAVGAFCLDVIKNDACVFFNKTLLDNLKLEDPYELVNKGEWTIDKLLEMASAARSDLNGDGTIDSENDQAGFGFGTHYGNGFMNTFGMKLVSQNSSGDYEYNIFGSERFIDIYTFANNMTNNEDYVIWCSMNGTTGMGYDLYDTFKADRLLFMGGFLRAMWDSANNDFRDMTGDYGIVPSPKYDSEQEDYVTYNLGVSYMSIPVTAKNPEMSAVMLEALNAESYKSTIGAYYDVALKGKFSRDDNTGKMLDIIYESTYFDFNFVNYGVGLNSGDFFGRMKNNSTDIASYLASNEVSLKQKLEDFLEDRKEVLDS